MEKKSKALRYRSMIPALKLENSSRIPIRKQSSPIDSKKYNMSISSSKQYLCRKLFNSDYNKDSSSKLAEISFNLGFDDDFQNNLSEASTDLERAQMTIEDFRSYEWRKTERKLHINSNPITQDSFDIACSLSDLYQFHSNISKIIAFIENESSDKFSISLANLTLNLSIIKSGFELIKKEEITQTLFDFYDNRIDEEQEEDFKRAYNELWNPEGKIPLQFSLNTDSQVQTEIKNQQVRSLTQTKNVISEKLEWQSAELSILKQRYNENLKEVNRNMLNLDYQHKVVKQQTINYVKGKERIEHDKRALKKEKECFKQVKIQHKAKVKRFKERAKDCLEYLKQNFSLNLTYSSTSKESNDSELSSLQQQISELEKSFSVSPDAERADKEIVLSHLKNKYAELRSSNALQDFSNKATLNSFVFNDLNHSCNASLHSEDTHSENYENIPLLREITIIKARLHEKQLELNNREKELIIQWTATFVVDDILPEILRRSEYLQKMEDHLDRVQGDLDRQKVQIALRQSQMHKRESEITHRQDMLYRNVCNLYNELDRIIHQII